MAGAFEVRRDAVDPGAPTTGELFVEGEHFCWTLEDPWINNRVGQSCIPAGSYRVVLTISARFGRQMPRLLDVPGRLGILIHTGNTDADTEGCILVGDKRLGDEVLNSRAAFARFLEWFSSIGNEAVITISNAIPAFSQEVF